MTETLLLTLSGDPLLDRFFVSEPYEAFRQAKELSLKMEEVKLKRPSLYEMATSITEQVYDLLLSLIGNSS